MAFFDKCIEVYKHGQNCIELYIFQVGNCIHVYLVLQNRKFCSRRTRKARKAQFFSVSSSAKKLLQYIRSYSSQCSGRRLSSWLTRPSTSSKSTHTYSCSLGAPRQQQPGIFYYLSRDQKSSSQTKVSDGLEEPQKYDAFGQQTMKSRDENAEKRPQPQQPSWLIILAYVSHLDFRQQMLTK